MYILKLKTMYKNTIVILLLIVLLSSCISIREISLDQLQPAEICFPEQIKSVAVISTIPQNNLDTIKLDKNSSLVGDQSISKEIIAKRIADANYFEHVIVYDTVVSNRFDEQNVNTLSTEAVNEMLNDFNSEMIISLDKMNLTIEKLKTSSEYPMDILRFITKPEIKFYIPKKNGPIYTIAKNDTLFFSVLDLIDHKAAFSYAYDSAIKKTVEMILPHWKSIVRYYYVGGSYEMRDADVSVKENDWDNAFHLWKVVYDSKKGKLRSYSAFNIALYNEIKDNVPEALKWLDLADENIKQDSDLGALIKSYRNILSERDNQLSKLKLQMNRFDSNN